MIHHEQICLISFASMFWVITTLGTRVFHTFRIAVLLNLFSPVGESVTSIRR